MLIKPNKQYQILCKKVGADQLPLNIWKLDVKPTNKAWKIVNQDIQIGSIVHGHLILSVTDCTPDFMEVAVYDKSNISEFEDDDSISEEELMEAVNGSSYSYAASPFFGRAYRCQICNGVVANDICTDCMFDWDS